MTETGDQPLEAILRHCARCAPEPWYPSLFSQSTGTPRERIDPDLDRLRLAGLIRLTDWVSGRGQGYVLTTEGQRILEDPRLLRRLRDGYLPAAATAPAGDTVADGPAGPWDRGAAVQAALSDRALPRVTQVLIALNVLVFVAGMLLASRSQIPASLFLFPGKAEQVGQQLQYQRLLKTIGAVSGPDVLLRRQWWRLLSCCFVHVGFIHLAVNMYALFAVGPLLEQLWGRWRFMLLYLLSGICGSCGMLIESPLSPGAGASGALWGILASLATWVFLHRTVLPRELLSFWRGQLLIVFISNLLITFYIPEISKGAHFLGGAVGLLAALPLDYVRFGPPGRRWLGWAALAAIPAFCVAWLERSFEGANGETIRQVNAQREAFRSDLELAPQLDRVEGEAVDLYNHHAEPLLQERPERRDPEEVRRTIGQLVDAKGRLADLSRRLSSAGPVDDVQAEKRRREELDYAEALAHLLGLTADALTPAHDRKEREARVRAQEKVVNELAKARP